MKEAMSAFDLHAIVSELCPLILRSRMENFYQINFNTLLLRLRRPSESCDLVIEAGRRIHLTRFSYERAPRMSAFCRYLRDNLTNGVLLEIRHPELERIVEFEVQAREARFRVIFEFFDKGNIIVTDNEGAILRALTYRKMRDRNIVKREKYKPPPSRGLDPRLVTMDDLIRLQAMGNIEAVRGVTRLLSLPGPIAEEILEEAGISKLKSCRELSQRELESVLESSKAVVGKILGGEYHPQIVLDSDGRYIDLIATPMKIYHGLRTLPWKSFNEAADEYFRRLVEDRLSATAQEVRKKEVSELERILCDQRARLEQLEKEDVACVETANLLLGHVDVLGDLLQEVREGRSPEALSSTLTQIMPDASLERRDKRTGELHFKRGTQDIVLDTGESGHRNISNLYDTAKEAREKARTLKVEIEKTERKIREKMLQVERIEKVELRLKKIRNWYEKFHWFVSSSGTLVLGGRDATSNEVLVRRHLENSDLVMHSDVHGAPFVILKGQRMKDDKSTLSEAAQFAASYSGAWKTGLSSVDVYWVTPEQVSKTPPSGTYLRKGMFVIYGTKNYVKDVMLGLAVGIGQKDGELGLVCGPLAVVKRLTDTWVSIMPGDMPSEKAARSIIKVLSAKASPDIRQNISRIPVSEVQLLIPSGRTRIVKDVN